MVAHGVRRPRGRVVLPRIQVAQALHHRADAEAATRTDQHGCQQCTAHGAAGSGAHGPHVQTASASSSGGHTQVSSVILGVTRPEAPRGLPRPRSWRLPGPGPTAGAGRCRRAETHVQRRPIRCRSRPGDDPVTTALGRPRGGPPSVSARAATSPVSERSEDHAGDRPGPGAVGLVARWRSWVGAWCRRSWRSRSRSWGALRPSVAAMPVAHPGQMAGIARQPRSRWASSPREVIPALGEDVAQVEGDRPRGDPALGRDVLVRQARAHQPRDLQLRGREVHQGRGVALASGLPGGPELLVRPRHPAARPAGPGACRAASRRC